MDPFTAAAVVVATTAASLYSAKKSREAQRKANKQNMEYNSPVAQMERLKAANLNPNLVYSSGNVVGNTEIKPVDSYGEGQAVSNALSQFMTIKNQSADIRNKENQAELFDATLPSTVQQAKATALRVQQDSEIAKAQARKARAEADVAEHDRDRITGGKPGYTSKDTLYNNAITRGVIGTSEKVGRYLGDKIADGYLWLRNKFK